MARKNIFDSLLDHYEPKFLASDDEATDVPRFGAARSISTSIDELARQASKLGEGETIVNLDPEQIDASFIADRLETDDEDYRELRSAIQARGQDTPILVRPHPQQTGRYMVVFGHRRLKVAKELGMPIRTIVRTLADIDHVVSQGQENSARANLSFIEKVLFAQQLDERGFSRETIQAALSLDYQTLSKMLTIPKAIPPSVIMAIGPAKGVGRDRWLELRKLVESPKNTLIANSYVASASFGNADSDERFELLFNFLSGPKPKKTIRKGIAPRSWAIGNKSLTASVKNTGKAFSLALKAKDAGDFGEYITERLDDLYEAFQQSQKASTGD